MFTITGEIKEIFPEQQINERFKKREFVLTVADGSFTQQILFQLIQDKCGLISSYKPGDRIKVNFNLKGREWKDNKTGNIKYFNSIEAWRIEREGGNESSSKTSQEPKPIPTPEVPPPGPLSDDDLPF
jgi:single-strand DNA-binding protein